MSRIARVPRWMIAVLVVLALLMVALGGWAAGRGHGHTRTSASPGRPLARTSSPPPWRPPGKGPIVPSDRTYKADLIEKLPSAPQLLFLGGSRSMRFEPAYAQRLTGLKGFNAAFQNARPEDAWAFINFLYVRSPATKLRVFWGLQPNLFYDRDMDPGLLQDARLSRFFPRALLEQQAKKLPATRAQMHTVNAVKRRRYLADGALVWNHYDVLEAQGRTLDQSLAEYIRLALKHRGNGRSRGVVPRAETYFEKTLALLNEHGTSPLLVIMPVHPRVLAALPAEQWRRSLALFKAKLAELAHTYTFTVLDMTHIASFGGDPQAFYDGVHFKVSNARKVIATAVREAPQAFR
jgi:hypothetical protein